MEAIQFNAKLREKFGKGPSHQYREAGLLPAVLYGSNGNVSFLLDLKSLKKGLVNSGSINPLVSLKIEGDTRSERLAIVKEIQRDHLNNKLLHADFLEVSNVKKIKLNVNLKFTGIPVGVKQEGGVLTIQRKNLNIRCLPSDIPDVIEIDLSSLKSGEKIQIKDISCNKNISFSESPNTMLATIKKPKGTAAKSGEEGEGGDEETKKAS